MSKLIVITSVILLSLGVLSFHKDIIENVGGEKNEVVKR